VFLLDLLAVAGQVGCCRARGTTPVSCRFLLLAGAARAVACWWVPVGTASREDRSLRVRGALIKREDDPSGDQAARAVGLRLHSEKGGSGPRAWGSGPHHVAVSRTAITSLPLRPLPKSRMPQGLAESEDGGKRVVTSRAAASDDARSMARQTPAHTEPPGRTTAVARTSSDGAEAPVNTRAP
jgi:hypothetical protein